ncbi:hypothetical protein ACWDTI_04360 [Gordonia sp. NPDC003424]
MEHRSARHPAGSAETQRSAPSRISTATASRTRARSFGAGRHSPDGRRVGEKCAPRYGFRWATTEFCPDEGRTGRESDTRSPVSVVGVQRSSFDGAALR